MSGSDTDVVDADELLRAVRKRYLHAAADAERIAVFRYLVVLRHVRVEVVLAVEYRMLVHPAAKHETAHHGQLDGLLVHDRQCARVAQADRAHVRVRFAACLQKAAAEHLRLRLQLDMRLQPYGVLEIHGRYYTKNCSLRARDRPIRTSRIPPDKVRYGRGIARSALRGYYPT